MDYYLPYKTGIIFLLTRKHLKSKTGISDGQEGYANYD
jgi:hypothetical protein